MARRLQTRRFISILRTASLDEKGLGPTERKVIADEGQRLVRLGHDDRGPVSIDLLVDTKTIALRYVCSKLGLPADGYRTALSRTILEYVGEEPASRVGSSSIQPERKTWSRKLEPIALNKLVRLRSVKHRQTPEREMISLHQLTLNPDLPKHNFPPRRQKPQVPP